jgi:hypothetical protein
VRRGTHSISWELRLDTTLESVAPCVQGDLLNLLRNSPNPDEPPDPSCAETFKVDAQRGAVSRSVTTSKGVTVESTGPLLDEYVEIGADPSTVFDAAWLRSTERSRHEDLRGSVRIVDLFSGCGVLTDVSHWTSY